MTESLCIYALAMSLLTGIVSAAEIPIVSHPPLRVVPPPSDRPLPAGPVWFVDAAAGDDASDGSQESPWRTMGHAIERLQAGDTLCLRGGTYYENVYVATAGRADAPITIRSYPGEQAVLDGGMREFFEAPQTAWQPLADGAPGEFRSAKAYPNVRSVIGSFGDSMIGLQTYYHQKDLRAENELWDWEDPQRTDTTDAKPFYCGPGLWYDQASGFIHLRLAHTHVADTDNYQGATDPRKVPLVLAPFRSVPLHLDSARHVRFEDLVIRGAGHDAVVLEQCQDITFDNVTVWCGTYGLRVRGTHGLTLYRSGLYGSVAPWTFRSDGGLQSYPGRSNRDISRYNTHALLVCEAGREFDVYALPLNDDWEIGWCDFCDAHDGLYLGGISVRFHHNRLTDMQDDGLYLSPMYTRRFPGVGPARIEISQSYFARVLTALAFGGAEPVTDDVLFVYRNVFDLRRAVNTGRPSTSSPAPSRSAGKVIGDHGSPPWPAMNVYQNTFVMGEASRSADTALLAGAQPDRPKRLLNNILLHLSAIPDFAGADPAQGAQEDGNLYWQPGLDATRAADFFARYRSGSLFAESQKVYPSGFSAHSLAVDPLFVRSDAPPSEANDYRLTPGSPAIDAGVPLPADWPDPLREADVGPPDIGALPQGITARASGREPIP